MKYLILSTFFILICSIVIAQESNKDNKVDSLGQATTEYLIKEVELLKKYVKEDTVLFELQYKKLTELARTSKQEEQFFKILHVKAKKLFRSRDMERTIEFVDSVCALDQLESFPAIKSDMQNLIGSAFMSIPNYKDCTLCFIDNLAYSKKHNLKAQSAIASNNLGACLLNLKRYDQAIKYLEESIQIQEQFDSWFMSHTLWNLGICYMEQKQFNKALEVLERGLVQAIKSNDKIAAAGNQTCIASVYMRQDDYEKGLEAYKIAYQMSLEANSDPYKIIEAVNGIIYTYNQLKKPEDASIYVQKADSIIKANNYPDIRVDEFLIQKSNNLRQRNMPQEAMETFLNYEIATDSLRNIENLKIIQDKETKYRTQQKQQQIELQKAEIDKQKYIIGISIVGTLLIGLIGFLFYRQQKLKVEQQKQEQILANTIHKLEIQQSLEQQRLHISKELHDNIGSQLTYLISGLENVNYALDITSKEISKNKIADLAVFSRKAILDLRDTIWVMNAENITWNDLMTRLNLIADKVFKTTQIEVHIDVAGAVDQDLDSLTLLNVLRIIQEAINNAVKYSNAKNINILIELNEPRYISITDDGSGFEIETVKSDSHGLNNMRSRAVKINGKLSVLSNEQGTIVKLVF